MPLCLQSLKSDCLNKEFFQIFPPLRRREIYVPKKEEICKGATVQSRRKTRLHHRGLLLRPVSWSSVGTYGFPLQSPTTVSTGSCPVNIKQADWHAMCTNNWEGLMKGYEAKCVMALHLEAICVIFWFNWLYEYVLTSSIHVTMYVMSDYCLKHSVGSFI